MRSNRKYNANYRNFLNNLRAPCIQNLMRHLSFTILLLFSYLSAFALERLLLLNEINVGKHGYVYNASFKDSIAYLASGYDGVRVLNIANRKNIRMISTIPFQIFVMRTAVTDNCLCIAGDSLKIADVTIPAYPFVWTTWEIPSRVMFLESAGSFIRYYCRDDFKPRYVNISDVMNSQLWTEEDFLNNDDKEYAGDTLFEFDDFGFMLRDRSHPFEWQEIGRFKFSCCTNNWTLFGQYCIGVGDESMHVIDASNPAFPTLLAEYTDLRELMPYQIHSFGNYALVATCKAGIQVIDIHNPMRIERIADTRQDIKPHSIGDLGSLILGVHNGVALIQTEDNRLLIYDVSKYIN